jgi:hypothetical protein
MGIAWAVRDKSRISGLPMRDRELQQRITRRNVLKMTDAAPCPPALIPSAHDLAVVA